MSATVRHPDPGALPASPSTRRRSAVGPDAEVRTGAMSHLTEEVLTGR